jgi:GAF domain-containing protein
MTDLILPPELEQILSDRTTPDAVFSALLPVLGGVLECDRIFLYLRHPQTKMGKTAYCWRRNSQYPNVLDPDWKKEPESLPQEDPLFAAALRTKPSIFVEDVETANPETLNKDFEHKEFGHRALIHAHLCDENLLWGILQPCIFGQPRTWTNFDQFVMNTVTENITPLAVTYVKSAQQ